jgi:putative endonuclease
MSGRQPSLRRSFRRFWLSLLRPWSDWQKRRKRSQSLGARGEREAERFLTRLGYKIVARNERDRLGELDLVAIEGRIVVFVEVKTLVSDHYKQPAEAVNKAKQQRLIRAAKRYLLKHELLECDYRFDVVSIVWPPGEVPRIDHIRHAFTESKYEPGRVR